MRFYSYLLVFMCGVMLITACRHEVPARTENHAGSGGGNTAPCDPNTVYFNQQVLPILVSNCSMSGCHDAASQQDGVVLTSYNDVMRTTEVRPFNPGESKIYKVLNATDPDKRMPRPPQAPLSQQQKDIIYKWIQQGAQNLSCAASCDSNSFTYSGAIKNIISANCQGCHSGAAPSAGIDLSTYNGVKAKVTDGRLWGSINHQAGFYPMPKNGSKLSDCEITQFKKWIAAGAPNN